MFDKYLTIFESVVGLDQRIINVGHTPSKYHDTFAYVVKEHDCCNQPRQYIFDMLGESSFRSVAVDSLGKTYCVGYVSSNTSSTGYDALIIVLDKEFNLVDEKRFSSGVFSYFDTIIITNDDDVICSGYSGSGSIDTYVEITVIFDNNLNLRSKGRRLINQSEN